VEQFNQAIKLTWVTVIIRQNHTNKNNNRGDKKKKNTREFVYPVQSNIDPTLRRE